MGEAVAEARFYHLLRVPLERALPQLLERCLARQWRAAVRLGSAERVAALDQHLWTYGERSFLPHGTVRDGDAELQPIWLTDGPDVPNGATVLFLADGAEAEDTAPFDLVCDLFDGNDPEAVAAARERWKRLREAGLTLTYWRQQADGTWTEEARHDPKAGG